LIFAKKLTKGLEVYYLNYGTDDDWEDIQGSLLVCNTDKITYKMENFKPEDYQFKSNGINSGYKFYSTDKERPFETINALLIETRIND
jgi:hypothetical protein